MILMRQKRGKRTRVCDARCYAAKTKKCHCLCLGENHGIGIRKAMENCRRIAGPGQETLLPGEDAPIEIVRHQAHLFEPIDS